MNSDKIRKESRMFNGKLPYTSYVFDRSIFPDDWDASHVDSFFDKQSSIKRKGSGINGVTMTGDEVIVVFSRKMSKAKIEKALEKINE